MTLWIICPIFSFLWMIRVTDGQQIYAEKDEVPLSNGWTGVESLS